jgi:membrane-associated phospholipid phosphatase
MCDMKIYFAAILVTIVFLPFSCFAQNDSLVRKLDSLERRQDTVGEKPINISSAAYTEHTQITIPVYFKLLGSNFKQQLTAPFHTSKKDWIKVGAFAALTGAVAFADMPLQKQALKLRNNSETVRKVGKVVTDFGGPYEGYTLAALGAYGFIFRNEKMKVTTLLATQAYITGGVIATALKFLTGRQRPNYFGTDTIEARPTFHGPFSNSGREYNGRTVSSAFPSGHATVAFAAATVFAMEYRNKPLVPIIAYTAASLISVSRVTENKHWATDVLVGAALGYLSGRQVVNNYHRFAKLKNAEQKGQLSMTLNFHYGQLMPGLVYRFQ